jgi:multisubunit Na+/H+ antiporter MnhF subunit
LTLWLFGAFTLLLGGFFPGLWMTARGDSPSRLVGLQFTSMSAVLTLLLLAKLYGQSSYLIVPLALALASFAGSLVFVRLLVPRGPHDE